MMLHFARRTFRAAKSSARNRFPKARLAVECLESRTTPATFGIAWTDARHLSLSFAPDGTAVEGQTSSLFATLDATSPAAAWERVILQAFQTWAVQANINLAVTADGGEPFGTAGAAHSDPRFGDIRIGAIPMSPEALSVSVPHDPFMSGTWAGDMLLNSSANWAPGGADLFTVALHEAGHIFGLGESNDPNSAMYSQLNSPKTGLSAGDIVAIQALYGVRAPDQYEGSNGNGTFATATQLQTSNGYTGTTPLVVYGDIGSAADADTYMFRSPLSNYSGPATVRVQSTGRSLLAPKLTVFDAAGNVIGQAVSASMIGDTVFVHLNGITPNSNYYIRVQGATQDAFGAGGYALAVTYDGLLTTPATAIDAVLRGPYDGLTPSQLQTLFTIPGAPVNADFGTNDTLGTATRLTTPLGYAANTHFETIGSIAPASDIDDYTFRSPQFANNTTGVLTATVWTLNAGGEAPQIDVYDRNQNLVPAQILSNGDGTYTVQVAGVQSGRDFYLSIHAKHDGSGVGNYGLSADFGAQAATPSTFASGSLTAAQPTQQFNLYVAESQLFHFLLSAQGSAGQVRMTIFDSSGNVVTTLTADAGDTVSGSALLKPGTYRVQFEQLGTVEPLAFDLKGESESDPIGPVAVDPTTTPQFTDPTTPGQYIYPDGTTSTQPYQWALLLL
jgi:hypothetical protein